MTSPRFFEKPGPDWTELKLPFLIASGRSFFGDAHSDKSLRFKLFSSLHSQSGLLEVRGGVSFYEPAQGPPLHAHGGALAYILDETMGASAWVNQYPVIASKLSFEYLHATPLKLELQVGATIEKVAKNRIFTKGYVKKADGEVLVTGQGEFVLLRRSKLMSLFPDFERSLEASKKEFEISLDDFKWASES